MNQNELTKDSKLHSIYRELDELGLKWINHFSSDINHLKDYYLPNSVLFPDNKNHLISCEAIVDFYVLLHKKTGKLTDHLVLYRILLDNNENMVYEIGEYIFKSKEKYLYMLIWIKTDQGWFRELEAIAKHEALLNQNDPLFDSRIKWGELASLHGSKKLIDALYTEDCVYYNRGNLFSGKDQLNHQYSYMNNSAYQVYLAKDISIVVHSNLAYEIGNWILPNYRGKYFVIWCKDSNQTWKMKLDSNW